MLLFDAGFFFGFGLAGRAAHYECARGNQDALPLDAVAQIERERRFKLGALRIIGDGFLAVPKRKSLGAMDETGGAAKHDEQHQNDGECGFH